MFSFKMIFVLIVAAFVTNCSCGNITEAHSLALEASRKLLALKSLSQKLAIELNVIRTAYPEVSHINHVPPWRVGELLVQASDEQIEQIRKLYGELAASPSYDIDYIVLKFSKQYNPEVLAKQLTSTKLLKFAQPRYYFGRGRPENIRYNVQNSTYIFQKGWGDCMAGCTYHHYWEFFVFPTTEVRLIREFGTPLGTNGYDKGW